MPAQRNTALFFTKAFLALASPPVEKGKALDGKPTDIGPESELSPSEPAAKWMRRIVRIVRRAARSLR